ncbi:MAG: PAS domain-containing protein [Desulfovibrionales bacterium]|nr:PAS domain-containing protein [Desulfovibrionales bacterium]
MKRLLHICKEISFIELLCTVSIVLYITLSALSYLLDWDIHDVLTVLGGVLAVSTAVVLVRNRKLQRDVQQQNNLVLMELAERKLTEHKLLRHQDLMQSIFNATQNIYYVFDELSVCRTVITAREDLLQFCHTRNPSGRPLQELFDATLAEKISNALQKSLNCKRLQIIEYSVERQGRERWMEGRAMVLSHSGCGPRKIVWIARDITEEKRNREGVRVLSSQLALSEEQQRRKIAVELHDSLGQILALVKMRLNLLRRMLHEKDSLILLDASMEQLGNGIELTRTLVWELSPPTLYALGVVPAVEWLGEKYANEHSIAFSVEDTMSCSIWGSDFKILLFRIVRELMANIVKHSQAKECVLHFVSQPDGLVITVQDDGVGFAEKTPEKRFRKGFGLLTIQESVRHLGGDVVYTTNDIGGHVRLFIPFKRTVHTLDNEVSVATGTYDG